MQNRNFVLDYLKLAFAFGVVALHTQFLGDFSPLAEQIFSNGLFRIAVPFFITISGYFFYDQIVAGRAVDWIKRLLALYGIWMLIYAPLWATSNFDSLTSIAKLVATASLGYHHLWYMIAMFYAALLVLATRGLSSRALSVTALLLYLTGWTIQLVGVHDLLNDGILSKVADSSKSYRNFLFFVFPFLVIGIEIKRSDLVKKMSASVAQSLAIGGTVLVLIEAGIHYSVASNSIVPLDLLLGLPIACAGLFVAAMKPEGQKSTKVIALMASAIYFVHPWMVHLGQDVFNLTFTPLTAFAALLSVPLAFLVVRLSRRFKYLL